MAQNISPPSIIRSCVPRGAPFSDHREEWPEFVRHICRALVSPPFAAAPLPGWNRSYTHSVTFLQTNTSLLASFPTPQDWEWGCPQQDMTIFSQKWGLPYTFTFSQSTLYHKFTQIHRKLHFCGSFFFWEHKQWGSRNYSGGYPEGQLAVGSVQSQADWRIRDRLAKYTKWNPSQKCNVL